MGRIRKENERNKMAVKKIKHKSDTDGITKMKHKTVANKASVIIKEKVKAGRADRLTELTVVVESTTTGAKLSVKPDTQKGRQKETKVRTKGKQPKNKSNGKIKHIEKESTRSEKHKKLPKKPSVIITEKLKAASYAVESTTTEAKFNVEPDTRKSRKKETNVRTKGKQPTNKSNEKIKNIEKASKKNEKMRGICSRCGSDNTYFDCRCHMLVPLDILY